MVKSVPEFMYLFETTASVSDSAQASLVGGCFDNITRASGVQASEERTEPEAEAMDSKRPYVPGKWKD